MTQRTVRFPPAAGASFVLRNVHTGCGAFWMGTGGYSNQVVKSTTSLRLGVHLLLYVVTVWAGTDIPFVFTHARNNHY